MSDGVPGLVDHLFRREAARMVAALIRALGTQNAQLAEDAVQDVLCTALEAWKFGGAPENPSAWLMRAAKNRAIDLIRRGALQGRVAPALASEWTLVPSIDAAFDERFVEDDELRLVFSCCDPSLSTDSQLAVILRYAGGFGIGEIANAFLATEPAIEKRLVRARDTLALRGALFDVQSSAEVSERLETVHDALYLLFNEGYHGAHPRKVVREELCYEALRLALLLLALPAAAVPKTHALIALMCFHAARLETRLDEGALVALADQDRSRWDADLIAEGASHLERAASGPPSAFHYEAAIASLHCAARSVEETDWPRIVALYDGLASVRPSQVVSLNRAIAVGMARGPRDGLAALQALSAHELRAYPFFAAAFGELHARLGEYPAAVARFREAEKLSRNAAEAHFFARRATDCSSRLLEDQVL